MKKKGFTLIELLAVIVILAVIALIVTPVVTKVIDGAKKGAANASALGYIDAVEKYMLMHDMNSEKYPYTLEKDNKYYVISDSSLTIDGEEVNSIYLNDFITVKGDMPIDGYVIIGDKNKVKSASLIIGGYKSECVDNVCEATKEEFQNKNVNSIEITNTQTTMRVSDTLNLNVTILPKDATDKVIHYTSSDEEIATVSNTGVVTALKKGTVIITAISQSDNTITDTITLEVKNNDLVLDLKNYNYTGDLEYLSNNPNDDGIIISYGSDWGIADIYIDALDFVGYNKFEITYSFTAGYNFGISSVYSEDPFLYTPFVDETTFGDYVSVPKRTDIFEIPSNIIKLRFASSSIGSTLYIYNIKFIDE